MRWKLARSLAWVIVSIGALGWLVIASFSVVTVAILAMAVVAGVITAVTMGLTHRTSVDAVSRTRGLVCPVCTKVVTPHGDGLACPGCATPFTEQELVGYWNAYPRTPTRRLKRTVMARKLLEARVAGTPSPGAVLALADRPLLPRLIGLVLFGAVFFVIMLVQSGGRTSVAVVQFLPIAFIWLGGSIAGFGLWRRAGATQHCPSCGYERHAATTTETCPECGTDWSNSSKVIRGRWNPSWRAVGIGAVIIALGLLSLFGRLVPALAPQRLLPTASIIQSVTTDQAWDGTLWQVLEGRTLSSAEEQTLAEGLLDLRRKTTLPRRAAGWLSTTVNAGGLSARLVERYYVEMLEPSGHEFLPGRPPSIELRFTARESPFVVATMYAAMESITIDGRMIEVHDGPFDADALAEAGDGACVWSMTLAPGDEWPPDQVEITVWLFCTRLPLAGSDDIWRAEGGLAPPPGTLWSTSIELDTAPATR